jgi:hypothetical protein
MSYKGCKDSSLLTKRKQDKAIAGDFLTRINQQNTTSYGPQPGIWNDSIVNQVRMGQMKNVEKCDGTWKVDTGCPCAPPTLAPPGTTPSTLPGWATYLFGSQPNGQNVSSVSYAVSNGSVYICGRFSNEINLYNGGTNQSTSPLSTPSFNNLADFNSSLRGTAFLAKYESNGVLQWVTKIGDGVDGDKGSISVSVFADGADGIYVTGPIYLQSGTTFYAYTGAMTDTAINNGPTLGIDFTGGTYSDKFLFKYNGNGQPVWGTKLNGDLEPTSVATFGGRTFLVGYFDTQYSIYQGLTSTGNPGFISTITNTDLSTRNGFIVRYNSINGTPEWTTYFSSSQSGSRIVALSVSANSSSVMICGGFENEIKFYDANPSNPLTQPTAARIMAGQEAGYLVKYDNNGEMMWATRINNPSSSQATILTSVVATETNAYVTGHFTASAGINAFVEVYDCYSNTTVFNSPTPVATISSINTALTNQVTTFTVSYEDVSPTSDPRAVARWITRAGFPDNTKPSYGYSIHYSNNFIYTAILMKRDLNLYTPYLTGSDAIATTVSLSNLEAAVVVCQYELDGTLVWATRIEGGGHSLNQSIVNYYGYPTVYGGVSANATEVYVTGASVEAGVPIYFYQTNNTTTPVITFDTQQPPLGNGVTTYNGVYSFLTKYSADGIITS